MLGMIKTTCTNECDQKTLIILNKSLVRSQLEYALQFWSPYTKENITALEFVQRRATKVILKTDLSYPERLVKLKGKISAQPHTTLCIQFLDRGNNDKNNTLPLGKQICFIIVRGCAEILPQLISSQFELFFLLKLFS